MSADAIAAVAPGIVDFLNTDHVDALTLVARARGIEVAAAPKALAIDGFGLTIDVGGQAVVAEFDDEVVDPMTITTALMGLVSAARAELPDAPLTAIEQQMSGMNALRTFVTSVHSTRQLTPHMVEISFRGGDLDTYPPREPDQFLYLLLPPPGRSELTIDQSFTWEAYDQMPEAERPVGAYYTVRRWHPESRTIDVVAVLHDDAGPASEWAERAAPGDPVALWGPRTTYAPPDGTKSMLLVADETGMHAVAAILETLPASMTAAAIIEVDNEAEHLPFDSAATFDIEWVHRDGAPAGTGTFLLDAVKARSLDTDGLYAWGGAESHCITKVREHLRREVGMAQEWVSMTGYWRRGGGADG